MTDVRGFVLWDFDGTLATRDGDWSQCIVDMIRRHHPEQCATRAMIKPHLQTGFPWHKPDKPHLDICDADTWWRQLYPVFVDAVTSVTSLPRADATRVAEAVRAEYLRSTAWRVYPDVVPCLSSLRAQGWSHIILSNHVPELAELIDAIGLSSEFVAIYSSAQHGYEKPHPEAFRTVLRTLPTQAVSSWLATATMPTCVGRAPSASRPYLCVLHILTPGSERQTLINCRRCLKGITRRCSQSAAPAAERQR